MNSNPAGRLVITDVSSSAYQGGQHRILNRKVVVVVVVVVGLSIQKHGVGGLPVHSVTQGATWSLYM
jgi:hypothetical protein